MLNHVSLIGRLVGDPWGWRKGEVDFTRFTLAVPRAQADPIDAPAADAVRVSVVAYGALASALRILRAGFQIAVTGRLRNAPLCDLDRGELPRLQIEVLDVRYLRFQRAQKPCLPPARGGGISTAHPREALKRLATNTPSLPGRGPNPQRPPPPAQEPAQGAGVG